MRAPRSGPGGRAFVGESALRVSVGGRGSDNRGPPRQRCLGDFPLLARSFVVKTEARKGSRLYRPDDFRGYHPLAEAEEKATATHEPTTEERIDQCMANWDAEKLT